MDRQIAYMEKVKDGAFDAILRRRPGASAFLVVGDCCALAAPSGALSAARLGLRDADYADLAFVVGLDPTGPGTAAPCGRVVAPVVSGYPPVVAIERLVRHVDPDRFGLCLRTDDDRIGPPPVRTRGLWAPWRAADPAECAAIEDVVRRGTASPRFRGAYTTKGWIGRLAIAGRLGWR